MMLSDLQPGMLVRWAPTTFHNSVRRRVGPTSTHMVIGIVVNENGSADVWTWDFFVEWDIVSTYADPYEWLNDDIIEEVR